MRSHRVLVVVGLLVFFLPVTLATTLSRESADAAIAQRVLAGRNRIHAMFKACDSTFQAAGFDTRYFVSSWNSGRFDIFEGVRLTLDRSSDSRDEQGKVEGSQPLPQVVSPEQCKELATNDPPGRRGIQGVAPGDVQRMRDVYAESKPDPHLSRDRSLHNDCMKANFNARQPKFDIALQRCDCTLDAMRTVPPDELDSWLVKAQAGMNVPMPQQPWFGSLLPKLLACSALQ